MKRVFLCAYERRNLGDDLFIQTIVRRYPRVRFCMKTDISNRETFRDLDNLVIPEQNGRLHRILGRIHPGLSNRYGSRWEITATPWSTSAALFLWSIPPRPSLWTG